MNMRALFHDNIQIFRHIWSLSLREYRWSVLGALMALSLSAASMPALLKIVTYLFDHMAHSSNRHVTYNIIGVLGIFFLKGMMGYYGVLFQARITQGMMMALRNVMFERWLSKGLDEKKIDDKGRFISLFVHTIEQLKETFLHALFVYIRHGLSLIFLVGYILYVDAVLALTVALSLPCVVWMLGYVAKKTYRFSQCMHEYVDAYTQFLMEKRDHMWGIHAFCTREEDCQKHHRFTRSLQNFYVRMRQAKALSYPMMEILAGLSFFCIMMYGRVRIASGHHTIGSLLSFIAAALLCYEPIKRLMDASAKIQEGLTCLRRALSLCPASSQERPWRLLSPMRRRWVVLLVQDVSYEIKAYNNRGLCFLSDKHSQKTSRKKKRFFRSFSSKSLSKERDSGDSAQNKNNESVRLLHRIDFHLRQGERMRLAGPNGCGKTTLMHLCLGFLPPTHGRIVMCDDEGREHLVYNNMQRMFGYVPQKPSVLHGRVVDHILAMSYGHEQRWKDLQKEEFTKILAGSLPQGLETCVGPLQKVSGGQAQKIALLRALIVPGLVYCFDEPTSAQDEESVQALCHLLPRYVEQGSVLLITHDERLYDFCSKTLILDKIPHEIQSSSL